MSPVPGKATQLANLPIRWPQTAFEDLTPRSPRHVTWPENARLYLQHRLPIQLDLGWERVYAHALTHDAKSSTASSKSTGQALPAWVVSQHGPGTPGCRPTSSDAAAASFPFSDHTDAPRSLRPEEPEEGGWRQMLRELPDRGSRWTPPVGSPGRGSLWTRPVKDTIPVNFVSLVASLIASGRPVSA